MKISYKYNYSYTNIYNWKKICFTISSLKRFSKKTSSVWDTSASRNGWRVRRTEWTKSSVQINIKHIFKLNATKYLVVCSCVMNEVRAVLDFFSASFASSLHILFLHVKLQCSETTNERIIYTHAPFYTRNNGEKKKKKKQNRTFCRFERVPRTIRNRKQTVHANRLHNSFSLSFILSLSLSSFLFLYLSLSFSIKL